MNRAGGDFVEMVVGLGNPGRQYENTRHNVGFRVVDRLAAKFSVVLQDRKFKASWGTGIIDGRKTVLIKPLTYMNLSGEAVGEISRYFGIAAAGLLVIHDDLDIPCGRIRIARNGGPGGHKGISSIIDHLGTREFLRIKLGIGRPIHGEPVESFVLQTSYAEDAPAMEEMIETGVEASLAVLASGIEAAMNRYNRRN